GGLYLSLVAPQPTALTSLALPLSAADLDGFSTDPGIRFVFLNFHNLSDGNYYHSFTPLQLLSITPVPEPSIVALLTLGALMRVAWLGKRSAMKDSFPTI